MDEGEIMVESAKRYARDHLGHRLAIATAVVALSISGPLRAQTPAVPPVEPVQAPPGTTPSPGTAPAAVAPSPIVPASTPSTQPPASPVAAVPPGAAPVPPTLTAVTSVAYPCRPRAGAGGEARTYELRLVGTNFSPTLVENRLVIDEWEFALLNDPNAGKKNPANQSEDCAYTAIPSGSAIGTVSKTGTQLHVTGLMLPSELQGRRSVAVGVGGLESNRADMIFSKVHRDSPRVLALLGTGLIAVVIGVIIALASRKAEPKLSWLARLFFEPQTNTYSLTKFQFYAWTAAAVLGYFYLAFAWSLVQGQFNLPQVPEGLPGIVGISAGTAMIGLSLTSSRPKGAGIQQPSIADFILSGGLIAADRLQFFVWTLVGVTVFLTAVLQTEPGTISTLPRIPDGLLWLSGISAFGYLGSKFVRKPGPTVDTAEARNTTANELEITLVGRQFSQDARIEIDGAFIVRDQASPPKDPAERSYSLVFDTPDTEPNHFKKGVATVRNPDPKWLTGPHDVKIINPDGQFADRQFEVGKAAFGLNQMVAL
jgi:hypothetical protein